MTPNVAKEMQLSWMVFAIAAVICAIAVFIAYDGGAAADREAAAEAAYRSRTGDLELVTQINAQAVANAKLVDHVEALKQRVGMRSVLPFLAPASNAMDPGEYFLATEYQIRSGLLKIANARSTIGYPDSIGFAFMGGVRPPEEDVSHWLKMLQLVSKSVYLALSAKRNTVQDLTISFNPAVSVTEAGPEGRPVLLRQYPFELRLKAQLQDVLWLMHQLAAEEPTAEHDEFKAWLGNITRDLLISDTGMVSQADLKRAGVSAEDDGVSVIRALRADGRLPFSDSVSIGNDVSPLIVRGLSVNSGNITSADNSAVLDVTFLLAGMEFLDAQERGDAATLAAASRPRSATVNTPRQSGGGGGVIMPTKHVAKQ